MKLIMVFVSKPRQRFTDIKVRIDLNCGDLKPHGFEQQAGRGCDDPLPDAAHASSRDKYIFHGEQLVPVLGPCQGQKEEKAEVVASQRQP